MVSPIRRFRDGGFLACSPQPSLYTAAYRRVRRRRAVGWVLVAVGVVMAVVHIGAHLGRLHLLGYQDLLIGYPMAAILVLAGVVLVGSTANA